MLNIKCKNLCLFGLAIHILKENIKQLKKEIIHSKKLFKNSMQTVYMPYKDFLNILLLH